MQAVNTLWKWWCSKNIKWQPIRQDVLMKQQSTSLVKLIFSVVYNRQTSSLNFRPRLRAESNLDELTKLWDETLIDLVSLFPFVPVYRCHKLIRFVEKNKTKNNPVSTTDTVVIMILHLLHTGNYSSLNRTKHLSDKCVQCYGGKQLTLPVSHIRFVNLFEIYWRKLQILKTRLSWSSTLTKLTVWLKPWQRKTLLLHQRECLFWEITGHAQIPVMPMIYFIIWEEMRVC